jgi:nucleotide-binding universal stress UspA family protein
MSRVIVGVDESPAGIRALRYGLEEARRRGSTLIAARVWSFPVTWPSGGMEQFSGDDMSTQASETVQRAFAAAVGAPPRDVSVEVVFVYGAPGPELVRLADRDDDLLVVGSRQRAAVRRALHASTAQYCAAHASCAVLVVPCALAKAGTARALARELQHEAWRLVDSA